MINISNFFSLERDPIYKRGLAKGEAKGIEEGRKVSIRETARKMKDSGLKLKLIAGITGLSAGEIEKL